MTARPPPTGLNDVDYEAIEAAVTETVRGRWFLNEFARRNRGAEVAVLLEAMARLELQVTTSLAAGPALPPPSADPSIRLLIQRIKEIGGQLDGVVRDMREAGVDQRLCAAVDLQARAVAGLMRMGPSAPPGPAKAPVADPNPPALPAAASRPRVATPPPEPVAAADDPRFPPLSELDRLPLAEKLALFT